MIPALAISVSWPANMRICKPWMENICLKSNWYEILDCGLVNQMKDRRCSHIIILQPLLHAMDHLKHFTCILANPADVIQTTSWKLVFITWLIRSERRNVASCLEKKLKTLPKYIVLHSRLSEDENQVNYIFVQIVQRSCWTLYTDQSVGWLLGHL